ncbi:hypothetical protein Tco_0945802 [Tanacetum coccineum]
MINGVTQLHGLVDGKKVIITESTVRRDLQLGDDEGMIRNLDNLSGKFLMYPRFVQVFLNQQLDGMPTHKRKYIAPSHTKKIFRNMRRVGKGFSDEAVHKELGDSLVRAATTASSLEAEQDSGAKKPWGVLLLKLGLRVYLNFPMIHCSQEVTHFEVMRKRSRSHGLKRIYKVGLTARVESSGDEESLGEDASKQGRIDDIDADDDITLVSPHNVNVLDDVEMFVEEQDVAVNEKDGVNFSEEVVEAINTAKLIIDVFQVSAASVQVSVASAATTVSAAPTTIAATTVEDITLAQVLQEMKSIKPKQKGVVIQEKELGDSTRTKISSLQS